MSNRRNGAAALHVLDNWQAGGALLDVVDELREEGHVTDHQLVAVHRLLRDMRAHHGSSNGVVSPPLGERVDTSHRDWLWPPGGRNSEAFERMTALLARLHGHERVLLNYLITSRELTRGKLWDWGRQHSGFQSQRAARAAATGQIRSLLETIGEVG